MQRIDANSSREKKAAEEEKIDLDGLMRDLIGFSR